MDVSDAKVFAHQWNYQYAQRYGSPEFSVRTPSSLGHDVVEVKRVLALDGGKSIFIEMPSLEPVMQMHLRMDLKTKDGKSFKTDLFPSVLYLGDYFTAEGEELDPPVSGKPQVIALRVTGGKSKVALNTTSGKLIEGARKITVNAIGGLQFEQKKLRAKAGEPIQIELVNKDVMPHNLVIVKPGAVAEVGEASFAMLNDPKAGEKHYIPETDKVIAHTFVVPAGGEHTLNMVAPEVAGEYPFICTFPGHWQAMHGVLVVE